MTTQNSLTLIPHELNATVINQRRQDGYIHATAMCQAAKKRWHDYIRLETTTKYLEALASDAGIPASGLINSLRGGSGDQGTWVHPKVAIHLAQWLSPEFAVQVTNWVHAWMTGNAPIDPMKVLDDPAAMRGLLLQYADKALEQEKRIEDLTPKAQAHDRLCLAEGTFNITEAAKTLHVQPKRLFTWMRHNGWIYKRAGSRHWLGYQDKVKTGLLDHKTTTIESGGTEKIIKQVRVTAKGLARLSGAVDPALNGAIQDYGGQA